MALAGGSADKYGNQYEAWWTIHRLMDLVSGREHNITLEPVGPDGSGVEFYVTGPAGRSYEQVKSGTSKTWSWKRTKNELLVPTLGHLSQGSRVRFVLAREAHELTRLTDLARALVGAKGQASTEFDQLAAEWGKTITEVVRLLSLVTVDHMPRAALEVSARVYINSLFTGDPDKLLRGLHGWLFTQTHKTIDAVDVVQEAGRIGHTRRDLVGDDVTALALARTVDGFESRVTSSAGPVVQVEREETALVLAAAQEAQVILVHGAAGSGKSEIVRQVLARLDRSWKRAIVRLDTLSGTTLTAADLGRAVGLSDSPTALLGGHANSADSLLVLDQLDAVSSFSGRMPDSFEAVTEILQSQAAWPRMRVLLVTRTVDLERDPRFRELAAMNDVASIEVSPLSDDELMTMLGSISGATEALPRVDKNLLRTPLYARLLAAVASETHEGQKLTAGDLFDAFEAHVRRTAPPTSQSGLWTRSLTTLARRMSDTESLSLQPASTSDLEPAVTEMTAAGLLVQDGRRTSFFHERYADHVFARSFLDEELDLVEFVVKSGQALFRRAQIRQILQFQLDRRPSEFFDTCVHLITDDRVRMHLQEVVYETLRTSTPSPQQWTPFREFVDEHGYRGEQVRSLLQLPGWLDAAHAGGHVAPLLEGDHREPIAHLVLSNAGSKSSTVEHLIRPHLGENWLEPALRQFLIYNRGFHAGRFVDDLVQRGHLDDEGPPRSVTAEAWMAFYGFEASESEAVWWLQTLLQRAIQLCERQGLQDPFADGVLNDRRMSGEQITDIARAQPRAFFEAVAPFIVWSAVRTADVDTNDEHQRSRWDHYYAADPNSADDLLLEGMAEAAMLVGQTDTDRSWALAQLGDEPIAVLAYLRGQVHLKSPDADQALEWLIQDSRNLTLFWDGDDYGTGTALIAAHSGKASPGLVAALEREIGTIVPLWERSIPYGWKQRGHAEWRLLLAFAEEALSDDGRRRRAELIRKFGSAAPRPNRIEGGFVGSPVPPSAAEHMTDTAWIGAIKRYNDTTRSYSDDFLKGGARELAMMLGENAKASPERYLQLAKSIWTWCSPVYRDRLVSELAGKVDVLELTALAAEARALDGTYVGRSIAWAADKYPGPWPERLVDLVVDVSSDPDPEVGSSSWQSDKSTLGHNISMLALNSDRGAAADALARHAWGATSEEAKRLMPTAARLVADEVPAVRAAACDLIGALTKTHRVEGLEHAYALFSRGLEPLATPSGFGLFRFLLMNHSSARASLLAPALHSEESEISRHAGSVWAALDFHGLLDGASDPWHTLPTPARVGVAAAWCGDEPELELLLRVVSDSSAEVRAEGFRAIRHFKTINQGDFEMLLQHAIESDHFTAFAEPLVGLLEDYEKTLPDASIEFAEKLLDDSVPYTLTFDRRGSGLILTDLFQVLLRLNRQNPQIYGARVLDCIDMMVQTDSARIFRLLDLDERT